MTAEIIQDLMLNGPGWPGLGKMHLSEAITGRMEYFSLAKPGSWGHPSSKGGGIYHTFLVDLVKRWLLKRKLAAELAKTTNILYALIG